MRGLPSRTEKSELKALGTIADLVGIRIIGTMKTPTDEKCAKAAIARIKAKAEEMRKEARATKDYDLRYQLTQSAIAYDTSACIIAEHFGIED